MIQLNRVQITVHPKITLDHTAGGTMDLDGKYVAEHEHDGIFKIWAADGNWNIINQDDWKRVGIKVIMGQAVIS